MSLFREFIARVLVAFAIVTGSVALGTWWASLLVVRTAGTLSAATQSKASSEISSQIARLTPGPTRIAGLDAAVTQALRDPAVTQALAGSVSGGSKALDIEIAKLDKGLGPLLSQNPLVIDVGQHALAKLANRLRSVARISLLASILLAAGALLLSPLRHVTIRHLAFCAGLISAVAILISWALPALFSHFLHGSNQHFVTDILSGGDPVRTVLLECLIGGAGLFLLTHTFELIGGRDYRRFKTSEPLSEGRVA